MRPARRSLAIRFEKSPRESLGPRRPGHDPGPIVADSRSQPLREILSTVVERIADAVFITDVDGTIVYVNPAFEQVTGFSREEALGRRPSLLRSGCHDEPFYRRLWDTVLGGDVFRGTLINRRKDGELFHADHTISPLAGADGRCRYLVAVARDITERLQKERHEADLETGREVQRRLYPDRAPHLPGFDIAGAALPANFLGGDYYDFVPMTDGALGLTVADVCGHGVGPSLLMAQARAYLRLLALHHADVGEVLRALNGLLTVEGSQRELVTQILVRLDPRSRTITFANAGHPSGLLLAGEGELRRTLSSCDLPLGTFPGRTYPASERIGLEADDILVLFTDGIPESCGPDGEEFGTARVLEVVRGHRHEPARGILDALCAAAVSFHAGAAPSDDMTAIVCRVDGPPPRGPSRG